MLKEYTLKVTVRVGGENEEHCDNKLAVVLGRLEIQYGMVCDIVSDITHEEVVGVDEVEREVDS